MWNKSRIDTWSDTGRNIISKSEMNESLLMRNACPGGKQIVRFKWRINDQTKWWRICVCRTGKNVERFISYNIFPFYVPVVVNRKRVCHSRNPVRGPICPIRPIFRSSTPWCPSITRPTEETLKLKNNLTVQPKLPPVGICWQNADWYPINWSTTLLTWRTGAGGRVRWY